MKENDNKEINLLQLLEILINWIKVLIINIFSFIGKLLKLLFRHLVLTLVSIIICLSIAIYFTRPSAKIYKADAIALVYGCDAQTVREISKQLENSGPVKGYASIASKLSLPDSVARNIIGFRTYTVIAYQKDGVAVLVDYNDIYPIKDTMYVKMRDRVSMQLLVKNINQIPQIQKAILNYFNTNEMLRIRLDNFKNQMNQQIAISGVELKRVDSLAKVSYFKDNNQQIRLNQNKLLFGEQQKQLFYTDLLKLQEIISTSKSALSNCKEPIEFPSGFAVDPKPINGIVKYSAYALILGLFISLVVAGLIENFSKITNYLKTKS